MSVGLWEAGTGPHKGHYKTPAGPSVVQGPLMDLSSAFKTIIPDLLLATHTAVSTNVYLLVGYWWGWATSHPVLVPPRDVYSFQSFPYTQSIIPLHTVVVQPVSESWTHGSVSGLQKEPRRNPEQHCAGCFRIWVLLLLRIWKQRPT